MSDLTFQNNICDTEICGKAYIVVRRLEEHLLKKQGKMLKLHEYSSSDESLLSVHVSLFYLSYNALFVIRSELVAMMIHGSIFQRTCFDYSGLILFLIFTVLKA